MSEIKHTPGPWSYEAGQEDFVYDAGGDVVADAWYYGCGETSEANARLIAAAPELLQALTKLLDAVRSNNEGATPKTQDEIFSEAGHGAIAAIAKATGSQP